MELASILANFFTNFFNWQTCVFNCEPIKTRALFTWFIYLTLLKMADAREDEHEAAFKFIEEVHNCPAVWGVSSVAHKHTKWKQKKMEELADKLGFFQTLPLFLHLISVSFSLFFCITVLRECRCTKPVGHVAIPFDGSLMCEGTSLPTF